MKIMRCVNFKAEEEIDISPDSAYLKRNDVLFDERHFCASEYTNFSNWEWYFNYLDYVQTLVIKYPNARPTYLLDLGYVPIVYLPSCCTSIGSRMMEALDVKKVPYIKIAPTSFLKRSINVMAVDAWVSKMDVYEQLGVNPEDVTSEMILRRIVLK